MFRKENQIDWLKKYVNSDDFLESYNHHSLKLMAEAIFWSVKLGLEPYLAKMTYADIREFEPLAERFSGNASPHNKLINNVCRELAKPATGYETSFALQTAALCVYVR